MREPIPRPVPPPPAAPRAEAADDPGEAGGRWPWLHELVRRPGLVLGIVLAAFVAVHLARLSRVLINADGENYLRNAVVLAGGDLPRSRYSPGWGFVLSPVAALTGDSFWGLYLLSAALNIALAVFALVLVYRFLRHSAGERAALVLVAIFALGQTATVVLFGAEVEPVALLATSAILVALQQGRSWMAVAATAAAAQIRIALVPFLAVLWVLRLRRHRLPALAALASIGVGLVAFAATNGGEDTTYLNISRSAYATDRGVTGVIEGVWQVVPRHVVGYARLGLPSALWPSGLLDSPVGVALGLATFLCIAVGAWKMLTGKGGPRVPDDALLRAATLAGLATFAAYVFWPANDGAKIRLALPLAPLVLLSAWAGARALFGARWTTVARPLAVVALAAALASTAGLVATQRTSSPEVADFMRANEEARELLPPGSVLSRRPALTQLLLRRPTRTYRLESAPVALLSRAQDVGACAVVVDGLRTGGGRSASLRARLEHSGARVLGSSGRAAVFAIDRPGCR